MSAAVAKRRAERASIEGLEPRVLFSTYLVTSAADSGDGSLRQAILNANLDTTPDEIDFAIGSGASPQTIALASPLPVITNPLVLNGASQPGYAGTPLIQISGYGLSISAGNTTVQGLCINSNNGGALIALSHAGGDVIQGNYLGTDPTGSAAVGDSQFGIYVNDVPGNQIGGAGPGAGNVISGSVANSSGNNPDAASPGIFIFGQDAKNNVVQGNYIGTNAAGTAAIPNQIGITISYDAVFTQIGGTAPGAGNVISGNKFEDIYLANGSHDTSIQGNLVGLNATGTAVLGSNNCGIDSEDYSAKNVIGGTTPAARNVVAGHTYGIYVYGIHGFYNTVQGNYIGTDVTGTVALGNTNGIVLNGRFNTFGGTTPAARNIVAGNQIGVTILNFNSNSVTGNYIGLSSQGTPLGNPGDGVLITNASGATIGGATAGAGNLISANGNGITIASPQVFVLGNLIGTDPTGTIAMGNAGDGIQIADQSRCVIGGATARARNVISGNGTNGVEVRGAGIGNTIEGNYVGTNAAGNVPLSNGQNGLLIAARSTVIGGTVAGAGNLISGNAGDGITIPAAGTGTIVSGNFIGTDAAGGSPIPNIGNGLTLSGSYVRIGGPTAGERNVISGNTGSGILIGGTPGAVSGDQVLGNYVGLNVIGAGALGNGAGISITSGVTFPSNLGIAGAGNVISGNRGPGILLGSTLTAVSKWTVAGNRIGTDAAGAAPVPNAGAGILIQSAARNTIGGVAAGAGNTIGFNAGGGIIVLGSASTGNRISGNSIFSNAALGIDLGGDGPTANHPGDADSGPNGLQNFPIIGTAVSSSFGTKVTGTLNSAASSVYTLEFFASPAGANDSAQGQAFLGTASTTTDAGGNAAFSATLAGASVGGQLITATATDSAGDTSEFSPPVVSAAPAVVGRAIFYNNSTFDGNDPAAGPSDDQAIAPDKQALLPGGSATFSNYTSYCRGINGIMVDVANPLNTPTSSDFVFRVGNSSDPAAWTPPPAPSSIVTRPGAGANHSSRIEIIWPDNAIQNQWIQITVKADAATGLARPDVFYFGNAVGETGNSSTDAVVDSADEQAVRDDAHAFFNPAPITDPNDFNRDGKVDATDQLIARNNRTKPNLALQLIDPPVSSSPAANGAALVSAARPPAPRPRLVKRGWAPKRN